MDPNEKEPLLSSNSSSKKVVIQVPEQPTDEDVESLAPLPQPNKPPTETAPAATGYTSGIYIMLFITFLASVCFSIVLPSIWPFLRDIMHAQYSSVGWAVAVNSAGSFLASPLFGGWSDRRGTREVLASTLILMIFVNVMYSLATNIWLLLAGRFIVGVAAANYAVAQTYLSYVTTQANRTKIMALNSAANVLGFIIGPAFALIFTTFSFEVSGIKVDAYTLPGYFSAVLSLFGLLSLVTLKEVSESQKKAKKPKASASGKYGGSGFYSGAGSVKDISQILQMRKKIPFIPVSVCLFSYFIYTCSFTVFETIGTPYTSYDFNWGVSQNSILYAALGFLCIISLVILQIFVKLFNDRILLIGTTTFMVAGFAVLFDYENHFVSLPRFCIAVGLVGAGYATAVAVLISIYSKVLEFLDQGMLMGWLSSSGSVARIIGPVFASNAFQYGGGRLVFGFMTGLTLLNLFVVMASYRVLAPKTVTTPQDASINKSNA